MDSRAFSQAGTALLPDDAMEAPPIVRFDERRMHIRAYNHWASLLGDRSLPSIEDLNPADIEDFGAHSVLLDFTGGVEDPVIAFLGSALASQCDIPPGIRHTSEIPPRTLLSRLTDHYLQIVANAAPIGFEAEFTNQRGAEIWYRGIMMPFSSDDDTIDFVYGVINWKEAASSSLADSIVAEVAAAQETPAPATGAGPIWADRPSALDLAAGEDEAADAPDAPIVESDDDSLGDRLALARDAAAAATASEGRTRHALYRAVGLAHAFARAAAARPGEYAELLAESGVVVQPRSPMTALAKLVFGETYDKTRLAEFVCAIDYALAHDLAPGALTDLLHKTRGGLKGIVALVRAERQGARTTARPSAGERSRRRLVRAAAIAPDSIGVDATGLAIVVMRRETDGTLVPVGALDPADKLADRVYSRAGRAR